MSGGLREGFSSTEWHDSLLVSFSVVRYQRELDLFSSSENDYESLLGNGVGKCAQKGYICTNN